MNMRRAWLALPMLLVALAVSAQTPAEVEIGYRWTDVKGNDLLYRSQINERNGLVLRFFTLAGNDEGSAVEHYRIDANDLGASPAGFIRLEAGKGGAYRLNLRYRTRRARRS